MRVSASVCAGQLTNEDAQEFEKLVGKVENEAEVLLNGISKLIPSMLPLGKGGTCVPSQIESWCTDQMREWMNGACSCIDPTDVSGLDALRNWVAFAMMPFFIQKKDGSWEPQAKKPLKPGYHAHSRSLALSPLSLFLSLFLSLSLLHHASRPPAEKRPA